MRYYFMPMIEIPPWRGAKYMYFVGNESGLNIDHTVIPYGSEPVCCVAADTTPQQHSDLVSNADVLSLPVNIDNNLSSGAVTQAQNFFELLNIPGSWINTTYTYREVLRAVLVIFQLSQRFRGITRGGKLFEAETLSTQWNQIPASKRQQLADMAQSLNLDTTGITATTTIRQMLLGLRDQLSTMQIDISGTTI